VTDGVSTEGSFRQGADGRGERRSFEQGLGLASSVALHGVVVALLLLAASHGVQGSHGTLALVPVEIETTGSNPHAQSADPPQSEANRQSLPDASAHGATPAADELETKLQALAKLSQPDAEQPAFQPPIADSKLLTTSDNAAPGRLAALRDFIRDQVERHWSLDLASLGAEEFSIPIRIEITGSGTVLKAEIINTARDADPVYREVASSARNAILSASPLSLPAGQYQNLMELILYLNPRETLH
jgi:hypothetical protein